MKAAVEIISELTRRGVMVRVEGESLRLMPKSALDDDLLNRVREHKPEILTVLSRRPATCARTCYEIEPGRWVHRPWEGCRTVPPTPAARRVDSECWHCNGSGKCRFMACRDSYNGEAGECLPCNGRGKVWTWVH